MNQSTFFEPKKTQEQIVLEIVRQGQPLRTEEVKIEAMKQSCSCPDRYLRWLVEKGKIISYKKEGDRTKTWRVNNRSNNENKIKI